MEVALWRWSVAVQLTSVVMIAIFFVVLQRSLRRDDLGWWARGWALNLSALAVALFFWLVQPPAGPIYWWVRFFYFSLKTLTALCLMQGAWALGHPGGRLIRRPHLVAGGVVFPVVGAFLLTDTDRLGLAQQTLVGVLFLLTAALLLRSREEGVGWLAGGFAARGLLGLVEGVAYAIDMTPKVTVAASVRAWSSRFLSASSSFDSGTEWLLALGFVLGLSVRAQRELQRYNQELLNAQEELRRLADRDPLTALANRRSLPEIFRGVHAIGAQLVFLDLDDFKHINDVFGHQAGDDCLKRFASALAAVFRPSDALVRYAGDEFLVVAPGLDVAGAQARVAALRDRLDGEREGDRTIRFSAGVATLGPGADPDAALREADEAMYAAKQWSSERQRA